jgi:hypothetical protein
MKLNQGSSGQTFFTLINKAEKLSECEGIRRIYDVLCDTVHPSIGSNRCFWIAEPKSTDGPVGHFLMSRNAPRNSWRSAVRNSKGRTMGFAMAGTDVGIVLCERTRNDLCLTGKIYALEPEYYGAISPGDPSKDIRKNQSSTLKLTKEEAQLRFDRQAESLSTDREVLRAFVIDTPFRSAHTIPESGVPTNSRAPT